MRCLSKKGTGKEAGNICTDEVAASSSGNWDPGWRKKGLQAEQEEEL